jgi:hypothetical protein
MVWFAAACGRVGFDDGGATAQLRCDRVATSTLSQLAPRFATASQIHWQWRRDPGATFVEYRLGIATAAAALADGWANWWTAAANPEFDHPSLLELLDDAWTMTDGHAASTTYVARVVAFDDTGGCHSTDIATATTAADYTHDAVAFDDAAAPATIPDTMQYVAGADPHYEFVSPRSEWENLRVYGLAIDLVGAGLTAADFDHAIVEVSVAVGGGEISNWSVLQFGVLDGPVFTVEPFFIRRDGSPRTYQVPLSALAVDSTPIGYDDLTIPVEQIGIGTMWEVGAVVSVDDFRIRW